MRELKNIKRFVISFIASPLLVIALSLQASALAAVNVSIVSNHAEGNSTFNVVIKDNPGTQLVMYLNGKSTSKATVNKSDQATFSKVKFTNTGKVTFKVVLQNKSHKSYQQAISFSRYYKVSGGKLSFSVNKPTTTASKPKKAVYVASLYAISDDNNIPMIRPAAGWDANDGWDTEAQANIDDASATAVTPAVVELNSHQLELSINVENTGNAPGTPDCEVQASSATGKNFMQGVYYGINYSTPKTLDGGPIDPGQYGNDTDDITITGQGALQVQQIKISC